MQRLRFTILLLCVVLAATASTAAAGSDDTEKTLITPLRNGVARIGAKFQIPTGAKILPSLSTGLKLHKHKLPQLPTGLKLPLHGKKHGRRLSGTTLTLPKFTLPTGPKFVIPTGPKKFIIPTGPKFVIPTGFKKIPFTGLSAGGGRRLNTLKGLKKIIPTGPIFVIPTGPKFVIPTGLKKKFPGKLDRRMH